MDEVLIGAADDVVVGDGDGVNAAAAGLQDVDTFQRTDVPNLTENNRNEESAGASESLTQQVTMVMA